MLYLKNSLVNLTIIFFSLFFLTAASTDDGIFIFPKKKINSIKVNQKKVNNAELSKSFTSVVMPRKNPIRENLIQQKQLEDGKKISELVKKKEVVKDTLTNGLPKKKLISQNKTIIIC